MASLPGPMSSLQLGGPKVELIPWDPTSPEHVARLFAQRVACGWKSDNLEVWKLQQREGRVALHWIVSSARLHPPD